MDNLNSSSLHPRIVVIGTAAVGKTALIGRIVENKFESKTAPTTGTAFNEYNTNDPEKPVIQIWDTAGMERYRSLNRVFYQEAIGALLCFDLTSFHSFEDVDSWLKEFVTEAPPNPIVILVGTKSDLHDNIEVEPEEIQQYAKANHLQYYATSALTGEGVDEMMKALIHLIPKVDATVTTNVLVPQEEKKKCC